MSADAQQAALDRALTGDRQSLGVLLDSLRPYIRFLVRVVRQGRLPQRIDDSDLIQDALLAVHRTFSRFQGRTTAEFLAWLRPIVVRTAGHTLREHLQTGKRDATRDQPGSELLKNLADERSSPSSQVVLREETVHLTRCLARLPPDMQRVLLGRHTDGLSYAVLGEHLQRSEAAVRVLYTRALRRLREECQALPEVSGHDDIERT